jgi:hypothetical protein
LFLCFLLLLQLFQHFFFFFHDIVVVVAISYCIIISYTHHARYAFILFLVFFVVSVWKVKQKGKVR